MATKTTSVKKTSDNTVSAEKAKKAKAKAPKVEIIRGRMPLLIVYVIRFADEDVTDSAQAVRYRTTVGKISDIRKNRNFGYITKDFAPTQDMVDAAVEYAKQLEDESVLEAVRATKLATEKQAEAFANIKKSTRASKKSTASAKDKDNVPEDNKKVSDDELAELTK